ncbi:SPASM domain-containing protein [Bacteroides xylanolyticus]|uniref:SPASM domain-containing protein n=1 Tax=Lacrimispora defluvii TaxID=2719233 RepID=A0ABX1VY60_9FIRM|nr:SPASM domain-containing protein [Lacrimispora defluvii]
MFVLFIFIIHNKIPPVAGRHHISIITFPCHRFVSNKETQIGTLNQGINEEKTGKLKFSLSESQCQDCWAVVLCGGGCPYENYQENKVIEVPDAALCHVMREVYDYILRKYLSMPDAQREEFFNLHNL